MIPSWAIRAAPYVVVLALGFGAGAYVGYAPGAAKAAHAEAVMARMERDAAQQIVIAEQLAREAEKRHAADMARIGQEHQEALTHAKAESDRLVSDLRAGTVRLREQWRGCAANLPGAGPGAGRSDEGAGLQAASLGRIDRAVAECEAQVVGLQNITRADRAKTGD